MYRNKNTIYYGYIYPTDEKLIIDVKIEPIKDDKDKNKAFVTARLIKIKEKLEKGDLKLIVGESIIGQLARMAIMGLKTNWVLLLIIAISVGVGAGGSMYAIGFNGGVSQGFNNAQQIYNSTLINPSVIPTVSPPHIVG